MRKSMNMVLVLLILSLLPCFAHADITLKAYRERTNNSEAGEKVDAYLTGFVDGLEWSNGVLASHNRRPFYCLPDGVIPEIDFVHSLISRDPILATYPDEMSIDTIIFRALYTRFPCKQ